MVVALACPVTVPSVSPVPDDRYSPESDGGVFSDSRSSSVSPGLESTTSNSSEESVKEVVKHSRVKHGRGFNCLLLPITTKCIQYTRPEKLKNGNLVGAKFSNFCHET